MNKQRVIIVFMVLILVVMIALISFNFNEQRNENPTTTATTINSFEIATTFSPIPIPSLTQTIVESTPTATESHFVEYTSYTLDELSLMGISLGMNITDVENVLGEPINITEEYYVGISGYLLYYEYEFGGVEFYRSTDKGVEESYVNSVYVFAPNINPLWGVGIDDNVEEVFSELEIPFTQIEQREMIVNLNDRSVGNVVYEHYSNNEVLNIKLYFGDIENYNYFYVTFDDGKVIAFGISGPHLA